MCSRTRGPARLPSFVTWPMTNAAMPSVFATRRISAAHSRTCDTEPGALATSGRSIVWMESMTTSSGFVFSMCVLMVSRFVSLTTKSFSAIAFSRSARMRICRVLSSPVT